MSSKIGDESNLFEEEGDTEAEWDDLGLDLEE
jgi:hypothetical protein